MDYDSTIFWFICIASLPAVVAALSRRRAAGRGSALVSGFVLLLALLGKFFERGSLIYTSGGLWLLLILLPALLSKLYYRRVLEQRYSSALTLARIICFLHPIDGWREQPQIIRALGLAHTGDFVAASEILTQLQRSNPSVALLAAANLYRLASRWEDLLLWQEQHGVSPQQHPNFLHLLLRAHGETGDVPALIQLYEQHKHQIARLSPPATRDLCRLMLFAFSGQREMVEMLFAGNLELLPETAQEFWLATADLASGSVDSAKRSLELLRARADTPMQLAIDRRLARASRPAKPLDSHSEKVLESATLEYLHDRVFGGQRSLFSKEARATQLLIATNTLMFLAELHFSHPLDPFGLFRLGALYPPVVRAGEWWRLVTSVFLHFGPLHLFFNMLGLWVLGPFVEFALGFRKFLFLYLVAGVSSMAFVMTFASGPHGEQLTVGASGAIMALVGATGALMLRGWMREKALSAKRRLMATLLIVVMQTTFDAVVPHVSMAAHLSGVFVGFALALLFPDRLMQLQNGKSERDLQLRPT